MRKRREHQDLLRKKEMQEVRVNGWRRSCGYEKRRSEKQKQKGPGTLQFVRDESLAELLQGDVRRDARGRAEDRAAARAADPEAQHRGAHETGNRIFLDGGESARLPVEVLRQEVERGLRGLHASDRTVGGSAGRRGGPDVRAHQSSLLRSRRPSAKPTPSAIATDLPGLSRT